MTNKFNQWKITGLFKRKKQKLQQQADYIFLILLKKSQRLLRLLLVGSDVKGVKVGDKIIYKNEYEATTVKFGADGIHGSLQKNIIAIVK